MSRKYKTTQIEQREQHSQLLNFQKVSFYARPFLFYFKFYPLFPHFRHLVVNFGLQITQP